jgi:hypothetical protein
MRAAESGRPSLSACIIVRDEAQMLPGCLATVDFCDEVLVVDSGSTDATVELARGAGARVLEHPWPGFAAQRNFALEHATGDWVLEVDADERISAELRAGIQQFLVAAAEGYQLAAMPRRQIFLGDALGRSAKYPEYSHRLLLRGAYRHDEARTVHEGLIPVGPVYPLSGDLLHLLATGWREVFTDASRYARLEADQLRARSSVTAWVRGALVRPPTKFLYRITIDGGWRDGWRGVAKIAVDCCVDSAVWTLHLLDKGGRSTGDSGVPEGSHYGARNLYRGSPRIAGVALGAGATERAVSWLAAAAAAGADVVLVSDAPSSADGRGVRVRSIDGRGQIALIRALDCEEQLRTIDGLVPFGWRATAMARLVPAKLSGHLTCAPGRDAATVVQRVLTTRTEPDG